MNNDVQKNRRDIIPNAPAAEPERAHVDDPKGTGWSALKIFFLIIFLIIACVGVAVGGYYYVNQRQNQRKRFY